MVHKRSTAMVAWVLGMLLMLPAVARGGDERLPVKLRVAILFKALSYDRNLEKRCPGGLRIGVVGLASNGESVAVARETAGEIGASAIRKVKGLSIHVEVLEIDGVAALRAAAKQKNLNTLYLGPGLAAQLDEILRLAREQKILVMSGEADQVQAGVALGVVQRDRKPKILVHTKAASDQGASFDARLLRLAEIVK